MVEAFNSKFFVGWDEIANPHTAKIFGIHFWSGLAKKAPYNQAFKSAEQAIADLPVTAKAGSAVRAGVDADKEGIDISGEGK